MLLAQANLNVAMSFCNSSFPFAVCMEYFSGKALASRGVIADENAILIWTEKNRKSFFPLLQCQFLSEGL